MLFGEHPRPQLSDTLAGMWFRNYSYCAQLKNIPQSDRKDHTPSTLIGVIKK